MTTNVEILNWVLAVLKQPLVDVQTVVETPWSSVLKINTDKEVVYLKRMPKLIALEAKIIQILQDEFNAAVPTIIASNGELSCFLMKDAGRSLRGILKQDFNTALLCKAIDQFTSLQIAVADRVDVFLEIGVPDWRLDKLPDLYREVISQKDLLIADGLSEIEMSELKALSLKIDNLCQKLSNYSIRETIVQPDFNDNNTLVDDQSQTLTIIDLGEIAISHPFFSLINWLHVIKKHYPITDEDDKYLRIKDACLKNYMNFMSKKDVLDAFEIAYVLWFVYGLLAHYRLMQACGEDKPMSFQHGKLSKMLKEFIEVCKAWHF